MIYECYFPNCVFTTEYKSKLDRHHIIPKEISYSKHTIQLCKNHHALIYVPESKAGQHSINTPESIQIIKMYKSTDGDVLHYKDYNGKEFYYFLRTKEIIEA